MAAFVRSAMDVNRPKLAHVKYIGVNVPENFFNNMAKSL